MAVQSSRWDYKDPLSMVLLTTPNCLYQPECSKSEMGDQHGIAACGLVHLPRRDGHFTTLALSEEGWLYRSDSSIGDEVLVSGRYVPMRTQDAIDLAESKLKPTRALKEDRDAE